jgi:hypothetical protein
LTVVSLCGVDLTVVKFRAEAENAAMSVTPKVKGRHHHGALRRALLDAVGEIVLEAGRMR